MLLSFKSLERLMKANQKIRYGHSLSLAIACCHVVKAKLPFDSWLDPVKWRGILLIHIWCVGSFCRKFNIVTQGFWNEGYGVLLLFLSAFPGLGLVINVDRLHCSDIMNAWRERFTENPTNLVCNGSSFVVGLTAFQWGIESGSRFI